MKRAVLAAVLILGGCTSSPSLGGNAGPNALPAIAPQGALTAGKCRRLRSCIQHVIVVVQENRSFDNVFAGFHGAATATSGKMSTGQTVPLRPIDFSTLDVDHGYGASIQDYDGGKMDKFDLNTTSNGGKAGTLAYSYLKRDKVAPYWSMAQQYTLADHMFPDEHGGSWTAHLDLIGTVNLSDTLAVVDFPSSSPYGCDTNKHTTTTPTIDIHRNYKTNGYGWPCFTQIRTMADTLDGAGVTWRYYAPQVAVGSVGSMWSAFEEVQSVRMGPDWNNVVSPPGKFLTDVKSGNLADVTWVIPEWYWSDHAGGGATMGPSWVAAVVNAIGESQYWKNTAIVVLWDDWGGFYDSVPPTQVDFKGFGLRVPCIVISPYAKAGHVDHTQYDFGSVDAFIEQVFDLPHLGSAAAGYADASSESFIPGALDLEQKPIAFKHIKAPIPPSAFLKMKPSGKAPDDE